METRVSHSEKIHAATGISLGQPCFTKPTRGTAYCLSLTLDDGSIYAPEFMHLLDKFYLPSKGLLLFFNHCTVTILGEKFKTLYQFLNAREVASIEPLSEPFDRESENHYLGKEDQEKALVSSITITHGQPEIAKRIAEFMESESRH